MPDSQSRKLTAILAADIAGYSALMSADEARTVRDLKEHHAVVLDLVQPQLAGGRHRGPCAKARPNEAGRKGTPRTQRHGPSV